MDPEIVKLLNLQEKDAEKLDTERHLAHLPEEIRKLEGNIADIEAEHARTHGKLKDMEMRRATMRAERLDKESRIIKYKNQQIEVKKNEEYTALTHEIEQLQAQISEGEDEELSLLMSIDEATAEVKTAEAEAKRRIELLKGQIAQLQERQSALEAQIEGLRQAVEAAAAKVSPAYLRAYENAKRRYKRPPFVIPIVDRKAAGLRVSGEVETAARKADNVVTNDNTGHVVYWPD